MSKKRNKIVRIVAVTIALLIFSTTFLTACSPKHKHTFSTAWQYDNTTHWHAPTCEHTTLKGSVAVHTFSNGECSVCGYKKSVNPDPDPDPDPIPQTYTVNYVAGAHGSGEAPATGEYGAGSKIVLKSSNTFTAEKGWQFDGWSDGNKTYDAFAEYTMPSSNVTFTAMWKQVQEPDPDPIPQMYTVNYAAGAHGSGAAPATEQYEAGAKITLKSSNTFTAEEGWQFVGWSDGNKIYDAFAEYIMPSSGVTFTAMWEQIQDPDPQTYTVNYVAGAHGSGAAPATEQYEAGAKITLKSSDTFTAEKGWKFIGWSDGNRTYDALAEHIMPSSSVTCTAMWEQIQEPEPDPDPQMYTVNYVAGAHGSGAVPVTEEYEAGTKITLKSSNTFTAEKGWQFVGWYDGNRTYDALAEYIMPSSSVTFTAMWKQVQEPEPDPIPQMYTVNYVAGAHGSGAAPATEEYEAGARITLKSSDTFTAEKGWQFVGWSDGNKTYGAIVEYTMPSNNVTFTAMWEQIQEPEPEPEPEEPIGPEPIVPSDDWDNGTRTPSINDVNTGRNGGLYTNHGRTVQSAEGWTFTEILDDRLQLIGYAVGIGTHAGGAITIPSLYNGLPVLEIASYGFQKSDITQVKIPVNIRQISLGAFQDCELLREIKIPETILWIQDFAFAGCTALEKVTLSTGVKYIPAALFFECTNLSIVTFTNQVAVDGEVRFSDAVRSIGHNAFNGTALEKVYFSSNLKALGDNSFAGCSLTHVDIADLVAWAKIEFTTTSNPLYQGFVANGRTPVALYSKGERVSELRLDGIERIGSYAFITTDIDSLVIGNGVKTIGISAFYGSSVKSVVIADSVTTLENLSESYTSYGTFTACRLLTSVKLGKGITVLTTSMFKGCELLTEIHLENVQIVGFNSFAYCTALESVNFGNAGKLTRIEQGAFTDCIALTDIVLPDSLTYIGTLAFEGCVLLENIKVPSSVTEIGYNALSETGYYNNQDNWTDGALYAGLHLIKVDETYFSESKTEFTIKNDTISVCDFAFMGCTGMTKVIIPISIKLINRDAFAGCTELKEVVYEGTAMEWFNITFVTAMSSPTYYAGTLTFTEEFSGVLEIPEGVTSIAAGSFKDNTGITKVVIPSSVTFIGDAAFKGCTSLTEIVFSGTDNVSNIGKDAFLNTGFYKDNKNWKDGLLILDGIHLLATNDTLTATTYVIGDNIRTISAGAFAERTITNLTIGRGVIYIGTGAFKTESLVEVMFVDLTSKWLAKNTSGAMRPLAVSSNLTNNAKLLKDYTGEWKRY